MVASAIQGKVAKVLNDREVVINRGKDHGVMTGAKFKLMETLTILDPDTKATIGEITREKLRLKVVHLEPSMSIARTYETYVTSSGESSHSFFGMPGLPKTEVKRIRLSGNDDNTVPVAIGDVAVELTDDDV